METTALKQQSRAPRSRSAAARNEIERSGVHTVPKPCRPRPVIKHMSQMSTATSALDLRAHHAKADVRDVLYVLLCNRLPETRPARAGFELGLGIEQRGSATNAPVNSIAVRLVVLAGESALGTFLACHLELNGRELLLPLGDRLFHAVHVGNTDEFSGIVE